MQYLLTALATVLVTLAIGVPPAAYVYIPPGPGPHPVLYWLHWHNGSARQCPYFDMRPDFIVVAPVFRPEADWKSYDLPSLVREFEAQHPVSDRWIEGYSRGAYGAAWHAAQRPDLFSRATAVAGGYPDFPSAQGLRLVAGLRDSRWLADSQRYAEALGADLELVDSTHDPWEFYSKWRTDTSTFSR